MTTGIIVGSAFSFDDLDGVQTERVEVDTRFGAFTLLEATLKGSKTAWFAPRHGIPHQTLPHQINWRAMCAALAEVGCTQVITTSSVGVLDADVPIMTPLLVGDIIMLDNRLPDGSPCTMWPTRHPDQGHLVLEGGVINDALANQLAALARRAKIDVPTARVVFGYVAGPRTKTRAENRMWATLGAQVNSMTLAPEIVLLNELELPVAALVVGHKYSLPDRAGTDGAESVTKQLEDSRVAMEALVLSAARDLEPTPYTNHIYRFDEA